MLTIEIPGYKKLDCEHLVLDYNGTIACDGKVIAGVRERLERLAESLNIHVLTADSFGSAHQELKGYPCDLIVIGSENQDKGKLDYIRKLGTSSTVCVGNGRIDRLMLKQACLGIAVCQEEGASSQALLSADIVCPHILSALDLLLHPVRLIATLRT
ncbi:MAG: ATPase P [Deltaproteobacteria bacterium]|nr:ATPase P [Deltaproteobacteria bacterium]